MNTVPEEWHFLKTAWRFAFLLTGCEEGATKVFQESVEEVFRHPHRGDTERTARLLFQIIRRRSLKFPARCELHGTLAALHQLPEPARSALALSALKALPDEHIQRMLDIDRRTYAEAVDRGEAALGPALAEELSSLSVSPSAETQIAERANVFETHREGSHHPGRHPTIIAVTLSTLLIIAVLIWQYLGRMGTFPEEAYKIASVGEVARADQFDPVQAQIGAMEDWFLLNGFENFRVPKGFEHFDIVGVRVFRLQDEPIAAAAAVENHMFFYFFRGAPLGIHVLPEKTWRISETNRLVMAIREENGQCFLIAFRGGKQDMERLLKKVPE